MKHYLFQGSYTPEGWEALVKSPRPVEPSGQP